MLINSKNLHELRGGSFDLVVCAGVSAAKWLANKEPEMDRAAIASLTDALATIDAKEFVLISTIDVYPNTGAASDERTPIDPSVNHAYGKHRLALERWAADHFPNTRVIRLPALFGEGLKKNVVFDLLRGNQTDNVNPASLFQWYPLRRLASDIERIRTNDIRLINLFPEPIRTSEILSAFFPDAKVGPEVEPAPSYRLRTTFSDLFGGPPGYLLDRIMVLGELAAFIAFDRIGH
jgi:dTDP-4-dehydrorhamnose reductase